MFEQPNRNDGSSTVNSDESAVIADIEIDDEFDLIQYIYDLEQRVTALEDEGDAKDEIIDEQASLIDELRQRLNDDTTSDDEPHDSESQELVSELEDRLSEKDDRITEQSDRIDELESRVDELEEYRADNEHDKADIRSTVHEADQQSSSNVNVIDKVNQKVDTVKSKLKRINGGRNSLEQIVRLPDEIAQEALSKNQLRARTIARDIRNIDWDTAMKGKVIESRAVRDKLRETYSNAHHQTVSRVMEFINEMGGEHVTMKQRNGRNKLVVDQPLIDQLTSAEQLDVEDIDQVNTSGVMTTVTKG